MRELHIAIDEPIRGPGLAKPLEGPVEATVLLYILAHLFRRRRFGSDAPHHVPDQANRQRLREIWPDLLNGFCIQRPVKRRQGIAQQLCSIGCKSVQAAIPILQTLASLGEFQYNDAILGIATKAIPDKRRERFEARVLPSQLVESGF